MNKIETVILSDRKREDCADTLVSLFCKGGYWGQTDNVIIFDD